MHYKKIKYHMSLIFIIILLLSGCSEVKKPGYKDLNISFTCMAFNCHAGTQLRIMLPISGAHSTHLSADQIGVNLRCESCHGDYTNDRAGMHQDGFVNGFNWLYNAKTPGNIIKFGSDLTNSNPAISFNHDSSTCSGTGSLCHSSGTPNWYSGSVCSSCHVNPPLSKYPPISGAHEVHRYNNYPCRNCHFRYTAQLTHNNGNVDGYIWQSRTKVAGVDIVIFNAAAGASASFIPTTSNCASLNCHVTRNWYSYTDGCSSCHRFPPLNQSTPTSGLHGLHQGRSIDCQVCHFNYAASNPLHNNGIIEGSAKDPKATVLGNIVNFSVSGSWNSTTQNCSGLPGGSCHGTQNWYTGGD